MRFFLGFLFFLYSSNTWANEVFCYTTYSLNSKEKQVITLQKTVEAEGVIFLGGVDKVFKVTVSIGQKPHGESLGIIISNLLSATSTESYVGFNFDAEGNKVALMSLETSGHRISVYCSDKK